MKKTYFLMLMALAFLLFNCRMETLNEENPGSQLISNNVHTTRLKNIPEMLKFLQSNPKIFNEKYGVVIDENQAVRKIETKEKTSYSLKIINPNDSVFYYAVYSFDKLKNNRESGMIGTFIPSKKNGKKSLDHFTGTSHFKSFSGEDIVSTKWIDGRIIDNDTKSFSSKGCTTTYYVIPALCSEGLHYPWDTGCVAAVKGYYEITSSTQCDQTTIFNDIGGGGGFGDIGGLGNGTGPIVTDPLMLPLPELAIYNNFPSNLKNYVLTLHNSGQDYQLVLFAIHFWEQNPTTTWEQFYNQFVLPHINIDSSLNNSKTQCILNRISGDTNQNDNVITLPLNSSSDNFVQKMLRNFNGVTTPNISFHISQSLPNNNWGETTGSTTNNFEIFINSNVENGSNLMKIVTISHELIHAYMFYSLHSAGVITFDSTGNPVATVNCYPTINYNGFVNLNNLTTAERFLVLFCLMNQNGTLSQQWSHEIFNTPSINANIYRQGLENYLLNSYDWDSENSLFKTEAINVFGSDWKQELSKAISWIGLEQTEGYASYMNNYSTTPSKFNYINLIRSKIQNANSNCQ